MKTRWAILLLLAFMGISLCLRIIPPYEHVFTSEWIKFTSADAYSQMVYVDRIAPDFWWSITHFTHPMFVEMAFFHWLLSGAIWVIGLGSPTQHTIDTVAVYFPAVLGVLTIIPVYFLGKAMFGQFVGLMAAGLIAILPGEWLGRSSLGFTDYHVLEVLLTTTALMFLVLAIETGDKRRIIYGLLAGLFMGLYWLTWAGAWLFVVVLGACLLVQLMRMSLQRRNYLGVISALMVGSFIAGVFYMKIIPLFITGPAKLGSMELQFLNLLSAWQNFGLIIFLIPVALGLLIYRVVKRGDASLILLLVWSLVMLAAMLVYRRFAYYFAINASLLTGWLVWYLWGKLYKWDLPRAIAITALLCGLVVFPNIQQATAKYAYNTPPDAWCDTLAWVKDNTSEAGIILAWWDYGHWIERMGGRVVYVSGGERSIGVAKMFLSPEVDTSINFDYLILDYATITSKFKGITIWASESIEMYSPEYYQTLIVRLYNGEPFYQYPLIYESGQKIKGVSEVKVFSKRRIKIIDGQ